MTSKTYYVKEGRKYIPVAEYDSEYCDSYPYGTHLVIVDKSSAFRIFNIEPNDAAMIAAGYHARDKMAATVLSAAKSRPRKELVTEEQHSAWQKLDQAFGDEMFYIEYPSAAEIVDAGLKAMSQEAEKMLEHPAVKDAYENFMLVWKLVKDQQKEIE